MSVCFCLVKNILLFASNNLRLASVQISEGDEVFPTVGTGTPSAIFPLPALVRDLVRNFIRRNAW